MNLSQALTPEQVADNLQVNLATVYRMIDKGEILAKKIGKRLYRISPVWLSWLMNGLDFDILKMEKEDEKSLDKINRVLKQVRME
ncbi:helix-turn-helix domain-containing protein [Patescibacteria group bacterium]|nr:helix-turn-helix domain-containing protein [Patescibacteria group bacterium]MCG2702022.1 helix-turn-helix domain-containing protein [Candidatus Parcubacteria bacterium]MBU4265542.1 helix-turn-helix domain-containing protein [Patescibacteria group bacterium]MBU4389871.1 helix-turn-helix domain-containing protein [Patescibacteria group bacterium]MBU4397256.1 helix-turn-helix domain-containing protein [Patescibacteria group bacterium]